MPNPNVRGFSQLAMEVYAYTQSYMRDGSLHIPTDRTQRMSVAGARWSEALNQGWVMRRSLARDGALPDALDNIRARDRFDSIAGGYYTPSTPVERAYGIPASFREE